jgi:mannose-6-phosphate isomerase
MDLHIYPLLFKPVFKQRLWGGTQLYDFLNLPHEKTEKAVGECWYIADRDDDQTHIANGAYEGLSLNELVSNYPAKFVGSKHRSHEKFPLLLKYIDADKRLSLQVHPDDIIAKKFPGAESKNEVWYVLAHKDNAQIHAGLRHDKTQLQFRTRIGRHDIEECVQAFPSRAGDAFYIPAGTVHCIGGGNLVLEIMQNSDTTFRVHDWARMDEHGDERELHIEQALESIHFKDRTLPLVRADQSPITANRKKDLVRNNKYFKCEEVKLVGKYFSNTSPKTFHVVVPIDSEILISCRAGEYKVAKGQPCLLPAALGDYNILPEDGRTSTVVRAMLSM